MWHVMSLLHLLFTIQRPEAESCQSGPWHNSSPSQSGGPGLVHNSLPDYEQRDRADTESGVHETLTPSATVRLDEEEQDSIGEHQEEFTNVAGISSLSSSFLCTAVPPLMGGCMVLRSENISSNTAPTEEVHGGPGTSILPNSEDLQASNQEVPGGLVTTDKIPCKFGLLLTYFLLIDFIFFFSVGYHIKMMPKN